MEGSNREPSDSDPQQRALVSDILREETLGLQHGTFAPVQFWLPLRPWLRTEEGILRAVEQHFAQEETLALSLFGDSSLKLGMALLCSYECFF